MSAPALSAVDRPTLRIRGTPYPVLLPTLRDPRLHLAAVIVTLQVLGQVAFDFELSIAQIVVSLLTCAVLEVGIAFRRQRVILWPASALLTGNGVAFVLRVPGTEHGDWWSMHGWWIFAGTSAVALLSKYLLRFRRRHVFNPSNIGLVLCFLLLGPEHADPLDLWWGPLSPSLVLALAVIVAGGFAILRRLHLTGIAVGFWLAFAAGIGVLAASGHAMTARWHLGPVTGFELWRVLVFSPEILVFLFFMITDPKTIPESRAGRRVYAIAVALLAVLLIAPQTTEFATKVSVLGALALVCAARPVLLVAAGLADRSERGVLVRATSLAHSATAVPWTTLGALAITGAGAFAALVVVAGVPARPDAAQAAAPTAAGLPPVTVVASPQVASAVGPATARRIARDTLADLRAEADALRTRKPARARPAGDGAWLASVEQRIGAGTARPLTVPVYDVQRMRLTLEPGEGQEPPTVVATLEGTVVQETYAGSPPELLGRAESVPFERTLELVLISGRYRIVDTRATPVASTSVAAPAPGHVSATGELGGVQLHDVAASVGLDFRHGAFRWQTTPDAPAMMGAGLCWLDYDADGWLDLYVVNSYSDADISRWESAGGLPRNALFHNVRGHFENVSRGSGSDLPVRGSGCVAGDFDGDGRTDLYVTTVGYNVATDGYDALLWNDGDGTFTEGARAAGITARGWHAGAAVGDVNGDGRPDLFVAGYTDMNVPSADTSSGFPTNHRAVRDRLYLNLGKGPGGHARFRGIGRPAGIETWQLGHGLGATFTDLNDDGRLDLYVANDADPNSLYLNVPWRGGAKADPAGLGFRFVDRSRAEHVGDANAGMGIAAADYSQDGNVDLFVTNSHRQRHAAYRSRTGSFADARSTFAPALDTRLAGWGVSWVDLDLDGDLELVIANGAIPITDLRDDAEPVQVLETRPGHVANVTSSVGLDGLRLDGRGLAAADYDNDGDVDVAISSIGGRLRLLQTTGATGHWLEVATKTFAPGTTVTAVLPGGRRLVREVTAGSSYLSSEDPRLHFGLGATTSVKELLVHFPDGSRTRIGNVAADRLVVVGPG